MEMEIKVAQEICRDELIANVTRGLYNDKDHALKVMKAMSIAYNMVNDLRVVTEISEDYFGATTTKYKILLA